MDKAMLALNTLFKGIRPVPGSPRTMKFPYTRGAQIAHFPHKFYWDNNWNYKYYIIAVFLSFPVFWKISGLANSPENVAKWAEIRRKEALEEPHAH